MQTSATSAPSYFLDERDDLVDTIDDRLASIGLQLPDEPLRPGGSYVLNTLAVAGAACGDDFSRLRLLSVSGYIRCVPEFGEQAKVMDGASEVFLQAIGDNGKHVRTAVGVYALPRQAPVEISTVFEVVNNND